MSSMLTFLMPIKSDLKPYMLYRGLYSQPARVTILFWGLLRTSKCIDSSVQQDLLGKREKTRLFRNVLRPDSATI